MFDSFTSLGILGFLTFFILILGVLYYFAFSLQCEAVMFFIVLFKIVTIQVYIKCNHMNNC